MAFLINASEHIVALSKDLSFHLLLLCEVPLLNKHSSLLPYPLTHVSVHIIFFIKYSGHGVHLAESYYMGVHMIIVEVLVIDASDDLFVLLIYEIGAQLDPAV